MADGLAHPGVIALPLRDGPHVRTRLVWHSHTDNPIVDALLDLATAWTRDAGTVPGPNGRTPGRIDGFGPPPSHRGT